MIKDTQRIKKHSTKLYSLIKKILMKVNEINAATGLFNDDVGNLYKNLISRLFEELGIIVTYFEDDYNEENIFFLVEQEIIFPYDDETEFSVFIYRKLFNLLLEKKDQIEPSPLTNALENHFLDNLISINNSFNKTFYNSSFEKIPEIVINEYQYFLDNLNEVFKFNFILFFDEYGSLLKQLTPKGQFIQSIFDKLPSLYFLEPNKGLNFDEFPYSEERSKIKKLFVTSEAWSSLINEVHNYINKCGYGNLSNNYYFEWDNNEKFIFGYQLKKSLKIEDIVGYDKQIEELLFNTESFINNFPSNNVLIYGYRGCGKTSSIYALLDRYKDMGLRLVKITKEDMDDLHFIVDILSNRKEKFIIFADDLSYEEFDIEYKRHKVILDNMLDKCPNNVIIYATSNTQDLVKFNKRFTTDDIRIDNRLIEEKKLEHLDKQFYDEKRALTDRFGLTLLFGKPEKEVYSKMLFHHAKKAGIDLSTNDKQNDLIKNYETWALYHGTFCGRSAQNFIGYVSAKNKIKKPSLTE